MTVSLQKNWWADFMLDVGACWKLNGKIQQILWYPPCFVVLYNCMLCGIVDLLSPKSRHQQYLVEVVVFFLWDYKSWNLMQNYTRYGTRWQHFQKSEWIVLWLASQWGAAEFNLWHLKTNMRKIRFIFFPLLTNSIYDGGGQTGDLRRD